MALAVLHPLHHVRLLFLRVDALPEGGSGIPLPTEEMEEIDLSSGIYAGMTLYDLKNGYLAVAMAKIPQLGELLGCVELLAFQEVPSWFEERDKIKHLLADHLATDRTEKWLAILESADIWCADVLDWKKLLKSEGYKVLEMEQEVQMSDGYSFKTTRCPIKIDGELLTSRKGTPALGEHTAAIIEEFNL